MHFQYFYKRYDGGEDMIGSVSYAQFSDSITHKYDCMKK